MYTKTFLDDEAINDWARSDSAQAHLRILQENALIIFRPGDWRKLSDRLPTTVWGRLKQDLGQRRQQYRLLPGDANTDDTLSPEVVLGSGQTPQQSGPYRCTLPNFLDAPIVDLRSNIRNGSTMVANREEFWTLCLQPIIDSLPPEGRTIDYFDAYAFQDSSKILDKPRQGSVPTRTTHSGLGWLLSKLSSCQNDSGGKSVVTIYTEVDPGNSRFSVNDISRALEQVTEDVSLTNLEVTVVAYKLGGSTGERRLHELIHHRSLVINRKCRFHFNFGLKDADSFQAGHPKNDIPRTWSWFRELSPEWPNEYFPLLKANERGATRLQMG